MTAEIQNFLIFGIVSLIEGLIFALVCKKFGKFTDSYFRMMLLLPIMVQTVIMLVGGNLGYGIAVAGAFSLIRFRSTPGSGEEITGIFSAMVAGFANALGYWQISSILLILFIGIFIGCEKFFKSENEDKRIIKITMPDIHDDETILNDILSKYTKSYELIQSKMIDFGSLYKLTYEVKGISSQKQLIDEIRQINSNLDISIGRNTDSDNRI